MAKPTFAIPVGSTRRVIFRGKTIGKVYRHGPDSGVGPVAYFYDAEAEAERPDGFSTGKNAVIAVAADYYFRTNLFGVIEWADVKKELSSTPPTRCSRAFSAPASSPSPRRSPY